MADRDFLTEAANRIDDALNDETGSRLAQFDPTWIIPMITILVQLFKACKEKDNAAEMHRMARAGSGFVSRFFGKGKRARRAVERVVADKLYLGDGQGYKLRRVAAPMVDAILDAGADATPGMIEACCREALADAS